MLATPDAIAADLRDLLAAANIEGLPDGSIRLQHDTREIPSTRAVIRPGDGESYHGMIGTARVTIEIDLMTPMDRYSTDAHRELAGIVHIWWRSIRGAYRNQTLHSRVHLHDIKADHGAPAIEENGRSQVTTFRGEIIATLIDDGD